ncbi:unnamed protein product [Chrysodeixis includens]|uniref:Uncharacterized protein n=1 Tax=Chrysodeixis includens TaxID=689277 RepID=A0A9N8L2G1_CHRIL|nr:unnamed protein product [Chrysodeixis includens]
MIRVERNCLSAPNLSTNKLKILPSIFSHHLLPTVYYTSLKSFPVHLMVFVFLSKPVPIWAINRTILIKLVINLLSKVSSFTSPYLV